MKVHPKEIAQKILSGDKVSLSKAITWAESSRQQHVRLAHEIINLTSHHTTSSIRIGITGVPGAGKSTFIEALGEHLIAKGHKVAVLAVDPSSYKSKGSILGDKTRMEKLSSNPRAFIRPTASGLSLGGLNNNTYDSIVLCEAAGYDIILIETVGVGQSEVEVSQVSDFFLLIMIGGAGDELQGVKRGIMEMCHGIVVNKSDGNNIQNTIIAQTQIINATKFLPKHENGWTTPVVRVSSINHEGLPEIWTKIQEYIHTAREDGSFYQNRISQKVHLFQKYLRQWVWNDFYKKNESDINTYLSKIENNSLSPNSALDSMLLQKKNNI